MKAPNFVQLFLSMYKVILGYVPLPNYFVTCEREAKLLIEQNNAMLSKNSESIIFLSHNNSSEQCE